MVSLRGQTTVRDFSWTISASLALVEPEGGVRGRAGIGYAAARKAFIARVCTIETMMSCKWRVVQRALSR